MATSTLASAPAAAEAPPAKSKKKLIMIVGAVLLLGGGGYYMLVAKPAAAAAAATAEPVKPKAGLVVKLDPIYINLEGGHFLKLGLAIQGTEKATKELDGSKALDAAISVFSGKDMAKLTDDATRTELKAELSKEVVELYEDEVMDIYFTEFVMQ